MTMQLSNWNPFKFTRDATKAQKKGGNGEKGAKMKKAEPGETTPNPMAMSPALLRNFFGPSFLETFFRDDWPSLPTNVESWFGDFSSPMFRPTIDVVDEGKSLRVSVELPGLEEKDVEVSMDDGALIIEGEKRVESKSQDDQCYRVERSYGSFRRVIPMPSDVDADKVAATMGKGVLTITVPKSGKASPRARHIPIGR
jgi:HSP20 family protein